MEAADAAAPPWRRALQEEDAMAPKPKHGTCPMDSILRTLMGPWTTYIVWILRSEGPQRFGSLKRKVEGISAKVLTERLRALEAAGLIARHYEPTIPPQVTYSLAPRGQALSPALDALNKIALQWASEDQARHQATEKDIVEKTVAA
jgi:DNA-binding HxlR family transcriptional regulator